MGIRYIGGPAVLLIVLGQGCWGSGEMSGNGLGNANAIQRVFKVRSAGTGKERQYECAWGIDERDNVRAIIFSDYAISKGPRSLKGRAKFALPGLEINGVRQDLSRGLQIWYVSDSTEPTQVHLRAIAERELVQCLENTASGGTRFDPAKFISSYVRLDGRPKVNSLGDRSEPFLHNGMN